MQLEIGNPLIVIDNRDEDETWIWIPEIDFDEDCGCKVMKVEVRREELDEFLRGGAEELICGVPGSEGLLDLVLSKNDARILIENMDENAEREDD